MSLQKKNRRSRSSEVKLNSRSTVVKFGLWNQGLILGQGQPRSKLTEVKVNRGYVRSKPQRGCSIICVLN